MMEKIGDQLIQAVEWKKDQYGVTGNFNNINLLSCLEDGDVTAHFPDGDETVSMKAGNDVVLAKVDITIISGSFAVN